VMLRGNLKAIQDGADSAEAIFGGDEPERKPLAELTVGKDEDPTARAIDAHGADETRPEPDVPPTLKAGLDIDAFRAELAKCKTAADVRVCCMEAAKTCGNPDEDATVEKEGKMRLDELKGGTK
jgi:hypothetical protein